MLVARRSFGAFLYTSGYDSCHDYGRQHDPYDNAVCWSLTSLCHSNGLIEI